MIIRWREDTDTHLQITDSSEEGCFGDVDGFGVRYEWRDQVEYQPSNDQEKFPEPTSKSTSHDV